jgi:EAL domain-containing protein (putative c-di-GMP-specific phosphodiesterase class I)
VLKPTIKSSLKSSLSLFENPPSVPTIKVLISDTLLFIEVFEKTGLIYRLDRFVWELAVQKLAQWQKDGRDDLYISVNISTKDFYYMDVYETITSLVETYKIIPSTLKLEITETAIMTGTAGELEMIERFRKSGFQVEIDDFCSVYCSNDLSLDFQKWF